MKPRGLGDLSMTNKTTKQGVCHTATLPFTLKKYLQATNEL
jgi:hypothetical protein